MINNQLNTFNDHLINITWHTGKDEPTLLVADCSPLSHFALFVGTVDTGFALTLHVYDVTVAYTSRTDGKDIVKVNDKEEIEIVSEVRPSSENESFR